MRIGLLKESRDYYKGLIEYDTTNKKYRIRSDGHQPSGASSYRYKINTGWTEDLIFIKHIYRKIVLDKAKYLFFTKWKYRFGYVRKRIINIDYRNL